MNRRFIIAGVLAVALIIAGLVLYVHIFLPSDPQSYPSSPSSAASASMSTVPVSRRVIVKATEGAVERMNPDGAWVRVKAQEVLPLDAVVRTGAGGRLELDVQGARVKVDEQTQLSLPQLVNGLRLGEGRVSASVPSAKEEFRIEVHDTDTVARSKGGEFAVLASKDGEATVAAVKGEVELSAKDATVTVDEGKFSTVYANRPPSDPQAIPKSLFLKVRSPAGTVGSKRYEVAGLTTPGAIISVNGVRLQVGPDGSFSDVLDLEEGKNEVDVRTADVLGRTASESVHVTVDSRPPKVGGKMKWGQ